MLNTNKMANKLTTKKCIITRQDGLVYNSPAHIPHIALSNISSTIQVRIDGMSTSFTFKKASMPNTHFTMASATTLRGISRINIDNSATFKCGFIFDKTLQLSESPFMHPNIVFGCFSDVGQIFHNNNVTFSQVIHNSFGDVVVNPNHKPFPISRTLFEFAFGCSWAFGLEFTCKNIMFNPQLLNSRIEFGIGSNSKIVYSEVDAKNSILRMRAINIDLSGECEKEKAFTLAINSQEAFYNFPTEILPITFWNSKWDFNPTFNCGDAQNIALEGCRTGEIVSDRTEFNNGFGFCFLNNSTGLFDTSDSNLRWQSFSQFGIDKRMQSDIIFNAFFPSNIDTKLHSGFVGIDSFDYLESSLNFDFSGLINSHSHRNHYNNQIFKSFGIVEIPSPIKIGGLLSTQL